MAIVAEYGWRIGTSFVYGERGPTWSHTWADVGHLATGATATSGAPRDLEPVRRSDPGGTRDTCGYARSPLMARHGGFLMTEM
jgi:hypothetical protein